MRIWSIHPKYLDSKGLVAVWREALLAKKVLENKTKGYKNHPQLARFKSLENPIDYINSYLKTIWEEGEKRGYSFDKKKFTKVEKTRKIETTQGQIDFEFQHLLRKLRERDKELYDKIKDTKVVELHPLFKQTKGKREEWEKTIVQNF